jgi:hypothetical protein
VPHILRAAAAARQWPSFTPTFMAACIHGNTGAAQRGARQGLRCADAVLLLRLGGYTGAPFSPPI